MELLKNDPKDDHKKQRTQSEPFESSLPPLSCTKKSLNSSPKRKVLTLKLPKVELNPRDTYFMGFKTPANNSEHSRYLSMSVDSASKSAAPDHSHPSPIKSNLNHYQLQVQDINKNLRIKKSSEVKIEHSYRLKKQKKSNFVRKYWKNSLMGLNKADILVKGEAAGYKNQFTLVAPNENSIYSVTKDFCEKVEEKYLTVFDNIDLNRNGFIVLDDIINYLILKGLVSTVNKNLTYLTIKEHAQEIFKVLGSVSGKSRVNKKDFFAVFSVFEYIQERDVNEELIDINNFRNIRDKIKGYKEIFDCYAKDGVIDQRELKSILACVHTEDIQLVGTLLFSESINFSRFLRYIPVFLWMHQEVVNQLDIVNKQ